ncbi:YciI family protein [Hwangdonia lutea]|uniref:YciI family protein n=1 Tax=Hwangdonia lutea TaxID=3075823 RepID=A0AA97ER39_9FLAO|nr:YciI family protein [Hwangdonia sp. SCSIO 19198]WOD45169.1 YciI family protein [Hwangdonia sp. SCSIO 19198]
MKKITTFMLLIFVFISCKEEAKTPVNEIDERALETVAQPVDSIIEVEVLEEIPVKKSTKQLKEELTAKGFKTFDYVDEKTKDTILMQQYFMAFLKRGPIRGQNEEEAADLQKEHLAHLAKMYELGYADISGPFGDDGDIRGITIYNVPTLKMADSLAKSDPMVKAGRLEIEIHPWWAAKGFSLR